jgi:hypothetical protein
MRIFTLDFPGEYGYSTGTEVIMTARARGW